MISDNIFRREENLSWKDKNKEFAIQSQTINRYSGGIIETTTQNIGIEDVFEFQKISSEIYKSNEKSRRLSEELELPFFTEKKLISL